MDDDPDADMDDDDDTSDEDEDDDISDGLISPSSVRFTVQFYAGFPVVTVLNKQSASPKIVTGSKILTMI